MDDFDHFKEILKIHQTQVLQFLKKLEDASSQAKSPKEFAILVEKEKAKVTQQLSEIEKRASEIEQEIAQLLRSKDTLVSDNLLLEYKKKDLLLLTTKLEEANAEISVKNEELLSQQKKIVEQSDRLNLIHQQILAKNEELEQQKESLLDQSDYLHEANQTITLMHEEVQKQKNEILQKNEELLNLNNEKNNLIGIVAHDLKSPLNQIKGLLTVVKMSSNLDNDALSVLNMMENSAERLTTLIAKILDVEAIESKQLNLIEERLNLSEILNSIVDRFEIAAAEKEITLIREIKDEVFVFADRIYTSQVFDNLISNAIKFSPSNKRIFVRLAAVNENAVTEVKDEGPGIGDDDKKKLFGKYQKLSAKPTGNESSTGLGLSIVKKFVESMNGRIWCESELGTGASFFVSFKLY